MAISEDTAALVAAQLTVAVAARSGPTQARVTFVDIEKGVLETYLRFKNAVAETDIGKA